MKPEEFNSSEKIDVVIPLSEKSWNNENNEVRWAIGSLRHYCSSFINRIIIATQCPKIEGLDYDLWLKTDLDKYNDKDINIIYKIKQVIEGVSGLTEDFIFWADDNIVTKETSLSDFQPRYVRIYQEKTPDDRKYWSRVSHGTIWKKRLLRTLNRFKKEDGFPKYFEPHIPVIFNKFKFMDMCNHFGLPKYGDEGFIIFSLYFNYIKEPGVECFDKYQCKCGEAFPDNIRHIGYFDKSTMVPEFRERMNKMFNKYALKK